jgi:hypothetical protein
MSKQVDEDTLRALLGFEAPVLGTLAKPILELQTKFLKMAGIKPGDTLEIKPIFSPGAKTPLSWVLKKMEE